VSAPHATERRDGRTAVVGSLVVAGITALALADGGFRPETASWASFALVWVLLVLVLLRARLGLVALEVAVLGALATLAGWTALSAAWSPEPERSLQDAERTLLYVLALLVVLALVREGGESLLLGSLLAATTLVCGIALVSYLVLSGNDLPDRFEGYLLFEPLGYANALGLLAALGLVLAVGIAAHAASAWVTAGAVVAAVPLAATLQLTSSRGGWVALAVGLAVFVAWETERRRAVAVLCVVTFPVALTTWLCHRADLHEATPRFDADRADRLALELMALTVVAGVLARPALQLALVWSTRVRGHIVLAGAAAALLLCGVAAVAASSSGASLEDALGDRPAYWRVALVEWRDNPLTGAGAATFGIAWREHEPGRNPARDAHSLYLESLAELGLLGLALVLVALAVPLVAALRARRVPLVPAALAGYVAFLVHAGLDWDWEMPAVTIAGLLCEVALLVAARPGRPLVVETEPRLWLLVPVGCLLALVVAELLANGALRA
jgi:hypothetical protein